MQCNWKKVSIHHKNIRQKLAQREVFVNPIYEGSRSQSEIEEFIQLLNEDFNNQSSENFSEHLTEINKTISGYDCASLDMISTTSFASLLINADFEFATDLMCHASILFCISNLIKTSHFSEYFYSNGIFEAALSGITSEENMVSLASLRILSTLIYVAHSYQTNFNMKAFLDQITECSKLSNAHADSCASILYSFVLLYNFEPYIDQILATICYIFEDSQYDSTWENIALLCQYLVHTDILYFNCLVQRWCLLGEIVDLINDVTKFASNISTVVPTLDTISYVLETVGPKQICFARRISISKYYEFIQHANLEISNSSLKILTLLILYGDIEVFQYCMNENHSLLDLVFSDIFDEGAPFYYQISIVELSYAMILKKDLNVFYKLFDLGFVQKCSFCLDSDDNDLILKYVEIVFNMLQASQHTNVTSYLVNDIIQTDLSQRFQELIDNIDDEDNDIFRFCVDIREFCETAANEFEQ